MPNLLRIRAEGDREIVMTRTLDASRSRVFDAWTQPDLLSQWLGVRGGMTMPTCEIDLRVGGRYRYVWSNSDGHEMGVGGEFLEVVAAERTVCTERFDEPWYPGEAQVTNALEEDGDQTHCTLTVRYEFAAARDLVIDSPMEVGVSESFLQLDELLANSA